MTTPTPEYPWQMVGTDLFDPNGTTYLYIGDWLFFTLSISHQANVNYIKCHNFSSEVNFFKTQCSIPEIIRSDNGPQYSSDLFAKFANTYDFKHVTSSLLFAQSNKQVERMLQTVKQLQKGLKIHTWHWCPIELLHFYGVTAAQRSCWWGGGSGRQYLRWRSSLCQNGPIFQSLRRKILSSRESKRKTMTIDTEFENYQKFQTRHRFGSDLTEDLCKGRSFHQRTHQDWHCRYPHGSSKKKQKPADSCAATTRRNTDHEHPTAKWCRHKPRTSKENLYTFSDWNCD